MILPSSSSPLDADGSSPVSPGASQWPVLELAPHPSGAAEAIAPNVCGSTAYVAAVPPRRGQPVAETPPGGAYARLGKRALDLSGAVALVALGSPVLAATAVIVRVRLGSPIIYRQRRIGIHGTEFDILKFRTMHEDRRKNPHVPRTVNERRSNFKSSEDPRHTRSGRFLRKWSIDEMPQLLNVARGEMSLVGPRPEIAEAAYQAGIVQSGRHRVRPGLTGLWQIQARDQRVVDNLDLDARYIDQLSFWRDMGILIRTVPAVLRGGGR